MEHRPDSGIRVHQAGSGFCAESPGLYVWDECAAEVLDSAEVFRHSADYRAERVFDYAIDEFDAISDVSPSWVAFAQANGAPELDVERVVGASLWGFIAGEETRSLYAAIFSRVRRKRCLIEVPFRCDSPNVARWMRLCITPADEKRALRLEVNLVRERYRVQLATFDTTLRRSDGALAMCSLCKRCRIDDAWLEPTYAALRLELLAAEEVPEIDYRVCADCRERAAAEMRQQTRLLARPQRYR